MIVRVFPLGFGYAFSFFICKADCKSLTQYFLRSKLHHIIIISDDRFNLCAKHEYSFDIGPIYNYRPRGFSLVVSNQDVARVLSSRLTVFSLINAKINNQP